MVISENDWEQKMKDIKKYNVDVFSMGHDWQGKFDSLKEHCEVIYLPRTDGISSTDLKDILNKIDKININDINKAFEILSKLKNDFS